jgi:hypothetical protein
MPRLDLTRISEVLAWAAPGVLAFYWFGCHKHHVVEVEKPNQWGAMWKWDGDVETPTISPSINIVNRCHMFVEKGQLRYLADCRHPLAGKTIPMVSVTAPVDDDAGTLCSY